MFRRMDFDRTGIEKKINLLQSLVLENTKFFSERIRRGRIQRDTSLCSGRSELNHVHFGKKLPKARMK